MNNEQHIKNAFTPEEKARGFENMDGYQLRIISEPFIEIIKNYLDFSRVRTIIEIGSRDGCQARELAQWFPKAKVYTFEPVPGNLEWVKKNCDQVENIEVVPCAVSEVNGSVTFYEVPKGRNVGASSLLPVTNHSRSRAWAGVPIEVESVRMDTWMESKGIDHIDIAWVDVQGAEAAVFNSFGKYLNSMDCISTEVGLAPLYQGGTTKPELDGILCNYNCVSAIPVGGNTEADTTYVNKRLIND
ncbi:MAG: FkbM family methyltransferase [Candidatus Kariarchaeaceae archaeon]|jgi:FkbM family methyltransferase